MVLKNYSYSASTAAGVEPVAVKSSPNGDPFTTVERVFQYCSCDKSESREDWEIDRHSLLNHFKQTVAKGITWLNEPSLHITRF